MRALLLTLHLLGACVWTGGHLVLAITVLPRALSRRDVRVLQGFEEPFERIGIPALIVQVLTGVWLAAQFAPMSRWLAFGNPLETPEGGVRMSSLTASAPALQVRDVKQVAALPLGGRIKLDAWSDQLSIQKGRAVTLMAANEKMPFEITPMFPYLIRETQAANTQPANGQPGNIPPGQPKGQNVPADPAAPSAQAQPPTKPNSQPQQ